MQRVAVELYQALQRHTNVALDAIILRSSWRMHHVVGIPWLLRTCRQIQRKAERGEIDAVLFSSMVSGTLVVLLQRTLAPLGIPMAIIAHGRDVTQPGPYQRLVRRMFAACDAVFPVSRATGAACLERGLPNDKLRVIPNGINPDRFAPLHSFEARRRVLLETLGSPDYRLPDDALLLCSVGRQVERKGFAWFIDNVMPLLPDDVHYWLAGNGPEAPAIADAIRRHGLEQRVRLLGRVSEENLAALYRGADLFLMPNIPVPGDIEGFGVVMLEAGLSGLPTIASRLEGIQDVITEGINGHLVESGNAWAFSEAIMTYYHHRAALEAASRQATRHTTQTFQWATVADQYAQAMRALLPHIPTDESPVSVEKILL
ncbi:MAG: glycosyltransferase family 4 protein [Rhodothermales bacterium]